MTFRPIIPLPDAACVTANHLPEAQLWRSTLVASVALSGLADEHRLNQRLAPTFEKIVLSGTPRLVKAAIKTNAKALAIIPYSKAVTARRSRIRDGRY